MTLDPRFHEISYERLGSRESRCVPEGLDIQRLSALLGDVDPFREEQDLCEDDFRHRLWAPVMVRDNVGGFLVQTPLENGKSTERLVERCESEPEKILRDSDLAAPAAPKVRDVVEEDQLAHVMQESECVRGMGVDAEKCRQLVSDRSDANHVVPDHARGFVESSAWAGQGTLDDSGHDRSVDAGGSHTADSRSQPQHRPGSTRSVPR